MTKIAKTAEKLFQQKFDEFVKDAVKITKSEAHVKSGALRDSITSQSQGKFKALVGVNGAVLAADPRNAGRIDYSWYYWKGHKAYTIRPVRAKALHWIDENGNDVFAKVVRMPAHPGDDFIGRAVKRLK